MCAVLTKSHQTAIDIIAIKCDFCLLCKTFHNLWLWLISSVSYITLGCFSVLLSHDAISMCLCHICVLLSFNFCFMNYSWQKHVTDFELPEGLNVIAEYMRFWLKKSFNWPQSDWEAVSCTYSIHVYQGVCIIIVESWNLMLVVAASLLYILCKSSQGMLSLLVSKASLH